MPVKKLKPTSPGRRRMTIADFSGLTSKKPEKRLTIGKKSMAGRSSSSGQITMRRRGGGHKRNYRLVDFKRADKQNVPGKITAIEYDPNRTARIALVHYEDGDKRYILAPEGLKEGDQIVCGERTKVKTGNRMCMEYIPQGYKIYNLEMQIGKGGSTVRSAGVSATLIGFDEKYALVQMPSGEVRKFSKRCYASIGTLGNTEHNLIKIGKAGRQRWLGKRPRVLGKSMNAADHPHGGGEGHSPIGLKNPKTPWGRPALGVKTRRKRKSSRLIVRSRSHKRRRR